MSDVRRPDLYATYSIQQEYQTQEERVAALNSLEQSLETVKDDRLREADLLYLSAELYQATKEYKIALSFFKKALRIYQELSDEKAIADVSERIGDLSWPYKNPNWPHKRSNDAAPHYRKALSLYNEADPAYIEILLKLVGAYFHRSSPNAAQFLQQASEWMEEYDYPGNKGELYYSLAEHSLQLHHFTPARTFYQNAIDELNAAGIETTAKIKSIIQTYIDMRQWSEIIPWCKALLEIGNKQNDLAILGFASHELGAVYYELERYPEGFKAFAFAHDCFMDNGDSHSLMGVYFDMALLLQTEEELPAALAGFRNALELAEKFQDWSLAGKAEHHIGMVHQLQSDWAASVEHCLIALDYIARSGNESLYGLTWHQLAVSYEALSEWAKALEFYKKADSYYYHYNKETNGKVFYAIDRMEKKIAASQQPPS